MANRQSRTQQSRNSEEVRESYDDQWQITSALDTKNIPAREGFVQRWVRTKVKGEDDQNNVFKKINQGWQVRPLSTVENSDIIPRIDFNGVDVIGVHGMILMERPKEMNASYRRHVKSMSDLQMKGVEENIFKLHTEGSGLTAPKMQRRSTVSRGQVPEVADD